MKNAVEPVTARPPLVLNFHDRSLDFLIKFSPFVRRFDRAGRVAL